MMALDSWVVVLGEKMPANPPIYYNKANNIRVRTEIFESETKKILLQAATNSPEFQKSIADYSDRKNSSIAVAAGKIAEIDTKLDAMATERRRLDNRLSFLLDSNNLEMAQSFRDEYSKQFSALIDEEREFISMKRQLQLLQRQFSEAQPPCKDGRLGLVNVAIDYIKKEDLTSLKSIYRRLFQKITISPLDRAKVPLHFVFNNMTSPPSRGEVADCTVAGEAPRNGFEPLTGWLTATCSTT